MASGPYPSCAAAVLAPDRLDALARTGLLDAAPDARFDRISRLVSTVLDVPVALVSLVDADRQYFTSQVGLPEPTAAERETPLSHSFCQHVVAQDTPLVIEDARQHPVLQTNHAIADLDVVAYLGVPIHAPTGEALGSLCAIDSRPRSWTASDRESIEALVASVEAEIALQAELEDRQAAEAVAVAEAEALASVLTVNSALAAELDPDRLTQAVVEAGVEATGAVYGGFFYRPGSGDAYLFAAVGVQPELAEQFAVLHSTPRILSAFGTLRRCADVGQDPDLAWVEEAARASTTVRSLLVVPVASSAGEPVGTFLFGHPDADVFDARAERVAVAIADQAAVGLQNARLHHALDESERRHRTVLAELSDVVFQTDADGHYTYLNRAWADHTGHAVESMLGRSFLDFVAQDAEALASWFAVVVSRTSDDGPSDNSLRVQFACADGSVRHFEVHGRALFDSAGAFCGSAGTLTDVTDTVRYQVERKAREEAERMARLQASFLANMSHEIRTPLTAILGNAEFLAEESPDDLRDVADSIHRGGQRLMTTLNSVLDLAQIDAGRMEPRPVAVDVQANLINTVRSLVPLADAKGLNLYAAVAGLPAVLVDPGLLDRAVSNLLGNAIKFTDRGSVTLRTSFEADRLTVEVEDTGIGIEPDVRDRLFDPFQQASEGHARTHEGNGLGLVIVSRVAELLGGEVAVESQLGEGSRFTLSVAAPQVAPETCA
ncbi:ATP-binding protein [Rubrivirga sp.]|uniref:ATP-binding protein n=1 Tax=Rubrivirga sp. TaxID=1885344 RepID=UPI003C791A8E